MLQNRKKVAIVGSGCSGIAALWALKRTNHEIHLYEAEDRLGGHTNTVPFQYGDRTVNVDTGFIVMNSATYPNFIAFLKEIGIYPVPTDMTFGISRDQGLFEWSGTSLSSIFAQTSNIFQLRMWQMIFDIIRFNQFALDLLSEEVESEVDPNGANGIAANGNVKVLEKAPRQTTIGEYLDQENYSEAFRNDYLIPMTASVWSTSPDKASLEFPAITLVRFMWNHHLLSTVAARPTWMTIMGGSRPYIDAVLADFPKERVHLSTGVKSLKIRNDKRIILQRRDSQEDVFDHVILATHGDQAMDIIRNVASPLETEIMSGFRTSKNTAALHSDLSLMPKRRIAWSSWNYITTSPSPMVAPSVCLTYWMNLLQHIPSKDFGPVLVTLNPSHEPAKSLTQGTWTYHHPLYNATSIRSQSLLPKIQNTRGISYVGAWTKYGFHEDGFSSGLKIAVDHLGAELPFEFVDSTFSRGRRPVLGWKDYCVRGLIRLVQFIIHMVIWVQGRATRRVRSESGQKKLPEKSDSHFVGHGSRLTTRQSGSEK